MKIQALPFERTLKKPLKLRGSTLSKRKGFYLECINTNQDSVLTEVSPLPYWSQESYEETFQQLQELEELPQITWQTLSPLNLYPSISFGVESALLHFETPSFSHTFPHSCLALKEEDLMQGYQTYKLKATGQSLEHFIQRVRLIKKQSPSINLRVDINQEWSLENALSFTQFFHPTDFEYLEEPLTSLQELISFSKKTNFPIAVDEMLLKHTVEDLLLIPSLKAVVIKPTLFGGYRKCKECIQKLPVHIKVVFSSSFETEVGLAHIARFCHLLSPNIEHIGLDTLKYFL